MCYSPPLLAGFRCRWWWAVLATLEGPGRGSPPLLAGVRWRRWCVVGLWLVCGVVGPSPPLAEVPVCYSPLLLAGLRCRWCCAVPRHSWLGSAGGGGVRCVVCGVWCVVCGGGLLLGLWLVCGVVGPSPLLAEVPVCYSPPLLAGFRCRWWWAVLATPRGGPRARFPATPGWVSLSAVVCGVWCVVCSVCCAAVVCWWGRGWCVVWLVPRHSWRRFLCATPRHSWLGFAAGGGGRSSPLLRAPGAVPRHSWLGSAGGGGVWWGCGWCVVWLVPRHPWRRFLCATPRYSWLGFAAGGVVRFPATPGWGLLAAVVRGVWCVVCGLWCAAVVCWWGCGWCVVWLVPRHSWRRFLCATPRHSWLGFAPGGGGRSSPLLAEGPGRGSPPLLAGFRCRRWCVVCDVWCVVCGVWRWCVPAVVAGVWCGWSLATPGGVSCVLLPATPGWVSLLVVVGGPRHSWLRVPGAVPRHSWLGSAGGGGVWWGCGWCVVWLVPRHSWRRFLCATARHSWLGFAACGGVWCVVCGVWCVACGGGVLVGLWLVCGVVGPSPLLAEVPVCYSPPLLAGIRCRWWWPVVATPC